MAGEVFKQRKSKSKRAQQIKDQGSRIKERANIGKTRSKQANTTSQQARAHMAHEISIKHEVCSFLGLASNKSGGFGGKEKEGGNPAYNKE